jgi:urea transport system substrate-binding protein
MSTIRTRRLKTALAVPAMLATAALVLAGCGARASDSADPE